jgi:hypothetical protein
MFIGCHLLNHLLIIGPAIHIAWMERFRLVYRHPVIDILLRAAVLVERLPEFYGRYVGLALKDLAEGLGVLEA